MKCKTRTCNSEARQDRKHCAPCAAHVNEVQRLKRAKKVAAGLCGACKEPAAVGRGNLCNRHADLNAVRCRARREGMRTLPTPPAGEPQA